LSRRIWGADGGGDCCVTAREPEIGEQHFRRILRKYLEYYRGSRTHLTLDNNASKPGKRESINGGNIIALPDGRRAPSSLHATRRLNESLIPHDVGREPTLRALGGLNPVASRRCSVRWVTLAIITAHI